MSRKKTVKGKGTSKSPNASPNKDSGKSGKGIAAAQANGVVHPSRPSLSNSGEFYDIAFKVILFTSQSLVSYVAVFSICSFMYFSF